MKFTTAIIQLCIHHQIPVFLENPSGSFLFQVPCIKKLMLASMCYSLTLDQCCFKAKWRKRTQIVTWYGSQLESLNRRCVGKHGWCSTSGNKHVILKGRGPGGQLWTSIAQQYPADLASHLGQAIIDSWENVRMYNKMRPPASEIVFRQFGYFNVSHDYSFALPSPHMSVVSCQ